MEIYRGIKGYGTFFDELCFREIPGNPGNPGKSAGNPGTPYLLYW